MREETKAFICRQIGLYTAMVWVLERGPLSLEPSRREQVVAQIVADTGVAESLAAEALNAVGQDPVPEDWTGEGRAATLRARTELEEWLSADDDHLRPALARAVAPILADLARTGAPDVTITQDEPRHDGKILGWALGSGLYVNPFDPDEDNAFAVADVIQSTLIDDTHVVWPPCPRHPDNHPLGLGSGGWQCPRTSEVIAPLGELGLH